MKKWLILILTVILILCFSSCNSQGQEPVQDPEHKHTKSDWKHNETEHWRISVCDNEGCTSEEIYDLEDHIDNDNNSVCDVCSYAIEYSHPESEWAVNAEYHWRTPVEDCTCNICKMYPDFIKHSDKDSDKICDVCSYKQADVAKFVTDYENELKEEVNKLNIDHPEYIYFYHPIDTLECVYFLNNDVLAEALVEKYNMNELFGSAKVSPWNTTKMITIIFQRDDFTEDMHQKLKQISEDEGSITNLIILPGSRWHQSYIPKIEYYTDSYQALDFEITTSIRKIRQESGAFIFRSKAEYDNYLDLIIEKAVMPDLIEWIEEQRDLYNEAFFEENALILTDTITRGSGSIRLGVKNVYISDNKVYIVVKTDVPGMGTDDMQYKSFTLKISKADLENVTEVITLE